MVNDFVYRSIHDRSIILFAGETKRTFIHIYDAIDSYLFALNNVSKMIGQVYNIGDETMNLSKYEIASEIKKHVDYEILQSHLSDLDTRNFEISFQKIKKLNFSLHFSLEDGIKDMKNLYKFYVK